MLALSLSMRGGRAGERDLARVWDSMKTTTEHEDRKMDMMKVDDRDGYRTGPTFSLFSTDWDKRDG